MERHWYREDYQFPRLLAALGKAGLTHEQVLSIRESTGLTPEQIAELLGRAEATIQACKENPEHVEERCLSCFIRFKEGT